MHNWLFAKETSSRSWSLPMGAGVQIQFVASLKPTKSSDSDEKNFLAYKMGLIENLPDFPPCVTS